MSEHNPALFDHLPEGFHGHETIDTLTDKRLRTYRHVSGLIVKVLLRPGFSKRFAALTVPYGSIHTSFFDGRQNWTVPNGTAHFLEHCVFSRDEQGGLLGHLSELGASANAYTSHTHTLYYFTAVDHFMESLDLYLNAVMNPYLESDRVEAEKPVILAELDQYQDDPDTRAYQALVESLYETHPVRNDIGGDAESVGLITSDDLKRVWASFYQPHMMTLTLVGDIDEYSILSRLAERLNPFRTVKQQIRPLLPSEKPFPRKKLQELRMDVSAPSFLVGIKDPYFSSGTVSGQDLIKRQRMARLVLDCYLSSVSDIRDKLFHQGLINDGFDYHFSCEASYAFVICGGESSRPREAAAAVRDELVNAFSHGLPESLFEIQKRAAAGDFVSSLDSIEHSGIVQARCNLYQVDLFDYPAIYDKISLSEAEKSMAFLADPDSYTSTLLEPLEVKK